MPGPMFGGMGVPMMGVPGPQQPVGQMMGPGMGQMMGGQDEFSALLAQMSPEQLQQLMGMGTLDERGQLMQQQQAQADALRQKPGGVTSTGAILGGLGNLLGSVGQGMSGMAQTALLGQKDAGRTAYMDLLRKGGGKGAMPLQTAGMGDLGSLSMFGLG